MRTILLALAAAPLVLAQGSSPAPRNLWIEAKTADAISGAPVAGARIELEGNRPVPAAAHSDTGGHFRFDGLRPGTYIMVATVAGYLRASASVVLKPGQNSTGVQISLVRPASMEGTVIDAISRKPVAGARISPGPNWPDPPTPGDSAGHFRLEGLRPDSYRLTSSATGYLAGSQAVILAAGQTLTGVRIALTPQAVIAGTVVDAISGKPIAGARIALDRAECVKYCGSVTVTDGAGRFHFDGLEAGPHELAAHRTGYLRASRTAPLTKGQHFDDLRIPLTPQAVVAGRVEDQDGFPVVRAGIAVQARGPDGELVPSGNGETDDRGRFRVSGLPSGRYYLRVGPGMASYWDARYAECYYPAAAKFDDAEATEVSAGQERAGILIRLPRIGGVRVQGRVAIPAGFSFEKGSPPGMILLMPADNDASGAGGLGPLAEDGSFALDGVPPGKYRLQAELPPPYSRGSARYTQPNLEVGGADVTGIVLPVEKTTLLDLRGEFVFEPGTEHDGALIALVNPTERVPSFYNSEIHLEGVPPGRYHLEASTLQSHALAVSARLGDNWLPGGNLELKGPDPGRLTVTFTSAVAHLEGGIVDATGQPVSGRYALFRATHPALRQVVVGTAQPNGRFSAVLLPGDYRVWTAANVPADLWDGAADAPAGQGRLVTLVKGENPPLRLVTPAAN
jgi:hypothetical protein